MSTRRECQEQGMRDREELKQRLEKEMENLQHGVEERVKVRHEERVGACFVLSSRFCRPLRRQQLQMLAQSRRRRL